MDAYHFHDDPRVDALLDDDDGQSGLVRLSKLLEAGRQLGHLVAGDQVQLAVSDAVTVQHDALRQAVVHLQQCSTARCKVQDSKVQGTGQQGVRYRTARCKVQDSKV